MEQEPNTPTRKSELLDLQATLFLCAPDNFPVFKFVPRTLESTIAEMRRGVDYVFRAERYAEKRRVLHELLTKAYDEFKAGKISEGRHTVVKIGDVLA